MFPPLADYRDSVRHCDTNMRAAVFTLSRFSTWRQAYIDTIYSIQRASQHIFESRASMFWQWTASGVLVNIQGADSGAGEEPAFVDADPDPVTADPVTRLHIIVVRHFTFDMRSSSITPSSESYAPHNRPLDYRQPSPTQLYAAITMRATLWSLYGGG